MKSRIMTLPAISMLTRPWLKLHSKLEGYLDIVLPGISKQMPYTSKKWLCHVILWGCLIGWIYACYYYMWRTPLPVYILDYMNLRPFFLPDVMCDHCNNFSYPLLVPNDKFCGDSDEVFLLLLVASFHANMNARQAIRKSWGGVREYRGKNIKTLFMFGHHPDPNLNNQMKYELEHYGDVIQADFREDYRTLTNKTMMALNWVHTYCPQAKFILKTDDDAFNVPQRYVDYLMFVNEPRFVGGYCFTVMPDRRQSSKFFVPESMFPDIYYPTYCSGPGYVLSQAALVDIITVAPNVRYVPMEDVYVTGLGRVVAGIQYTQIPGTAMDQSFMTPCNLATWVKNGHNIVPERTPVLWKRAESARRDHDCAGRNGFVFVLLLLFLAVWGRHLWGLSRSF